MLCWSRWAASHWECDISCPALSLSSLHSGLLSAPHTPLILGDPDTDLVIIRTVLLCYMLYIFYIAPHTDLVIIRTMLICYMLYIFYIAPHTPLQQCWVTQTQTSQVIIRTMLLCYMLYLNYIPKHTPLWQCWMTQTLTRSSSGLC